MMSPTLSVLIKIAVAVVLCGLVLFIMKQIVKRMLKKNNTTHVKFFNSLLAGMAVATCIYYILTLFEPTKGISKTILQSSALILAIATFAAQQALGNVISGFFIAIMKPYEIGAKIKVTCGGSLVAEGIVEDVCIRHTVIRTFDGQSAIVPNSVMDSSVIINTNYSENVGNFLEVEIGYNSDVDRAIEIVKNVITNHPKTLNEKDMIVSVSAFTTNGVNLKTTVWTKTLNDNFTACSDIRRMILKEFSEAGIVIPYNTITISQEE